MQFQEKWKLVNKGLLTILGAFVLATIASIIYLSLNLVRLDHVIAESGRSSQTVRNMQDLLINLVNVETGARGFIITDNETYLDPYNSGIKAVPQLLQQLRPAAGSGISNAEYKHLSELSDTRLKMLTALVAQKRANADVALQTQSSGTGPGKSAMDQLRAEIDGITARNLATIKLRQDQAHRGVDQALAVAVAVSLFVFGICIVLIGYFQRSILRERALENTKSEFLSLASHQLRTPATNVKQYVGLLLDGYVGDLTSEQRDALQVAYKNNELEIRIMNDLLDVAKLDLKRIQLRKRRSNVVSLVRQVVNEYTPAATAKDQTLALKAPADVMASIDREYMKGAIEKLIDNAVRYSRDKTRISVRVRIDEDLGCFEIVVKDQGLGIQKREVPKLFMKFSRLSNEFSANSEGSGMGLYWVKQIMHLHGGTIEVVSKEGHGSKFTVRAPLT